MGAPHRPECHLFRSSIVISGSDPATASGTVVRPGMVIIVGRSGCRAGARRLAGSVAMIVDVGLTAALGAVVRPQLAIIFRSRPGPGRLGA
jgi:hypothetical protein